MSGARQGAQPTPAGRDLLARCQRGFAGLSIAAEDRERALQNLGPWLTEAHFEEYRPQLEWLVEEGRWPLLLDSFFRVLPFGTGGRRGPVGIGTNRFNPFTLASSVQGHAEFLHQRDTGRTHSVVVVYDVRAFHDLRGCYSPERPNPLTGSSSRDLARIAAEVYSANEIRVYMPEEHSAEFVSTPELSFAIRRLGASAGLNISASHNHPDDNGGKFYNEHGAQHVPPSDEELARCVEAVSVPRSMPFARARAAGLIEWISPEVHRAYVDLNVAQSLDAGARSARVVFTPLHGTGGSTVAAVLERAGFRVDRVAEQSTPDGGFPGVPFRAPNPEVPQSMARGIELAAELGADLVMACDPDADRIGVCSRDASGGFTFLSGNEIAVLVVHHKLERLAELGRLPERPLVLKTEVTTELLRPVTEAFGGTLVGDLLVGFKYHGNVLERIEAGDLAGGFALEDFVAGVEESHGVLVTPEIRDKDAAGGALLLAELASRLRDRGETLVGYLDRVYLRYGYHANRLRSMVMTGAEGLGQIRRIQAVLRESPPAELGGQRVLEALDHRDERGVHGPILSGTDEASRDVLVFRLEGGGRVILRPSGTEPKNKAYIEVPLPALGEGAGAEALAGQKREGDDLARAVADDLARQMLAIIGVELPGYALRISDLVSLDRRIDFVEGFVPELQERAGDGLAGAALSAWIDQRLAAYGKDARGLVTEAMRAYLDEQAAAGGGARAAALAAIEAAFFDAR